MRPKPRRPIEPPISTFRVRLVAGPFPPAACGDAWREIEVAASQRLAELGDAIPLAFAIERSCPWRFVLPLDDGLLELRSLDAERRRGAARIEVRDLPLPGATGRREFTFLLDDAAPWIFGVKLVRVAPVAEAHVAYPRVVAMQGRPPGAALAPWLADLDAVTTGLTSD